MLNTLFFSTSSSESTSVSAVSVHVRVSASDTSTSAASSATSSASCIGMSADASAGVSAGVSTCLLIRSLLSLIAVAFTGSLIRIYNWIVDRDGMSLLCYCTCIYIAIRVLLSFRMGMHKKYGRSLTLPMNQQAANVSVVTCLNLLCTFSREYFTIHCSIGTFYTSHKSSLMLKGAVCLSFSLQWGCGWYWNNQLACDHSWHQQTWLAHSGMYS